MTAARANGQPITNTTIHPRQAADNAQRGGNRRRKRNTPQGKQCDRLTYQPRRMPARKGKLRPGLTFQRNGVTHPH